MSKKKHKKTKYEKQLEQRHALKMERRAYWENYIHKLYEKWDALNEQEQDKLLNKAYQEICPKEIDGKPAGDHIKRAYQQVIAEVKEEMIGHCVIQGRNKQYEEYIEKVKLYILSQLDTGEPTEESTEMDAGESSGETVGKSGT